ncbi:hypothetical protein N7G274_001840 [Stereocaulon virgatum]|uniref:Uncharacterized protein n=1 Tax=Stereocaulon virgatum TaxID=373712 RepID=A0ABR4AKU9_9LECA
MEVETLDSKFLRVSKMQPHPLTSLLILSVSFHRVLFAAVVSSAYVGPIATQTVPKALGPTRSNESMLTEEDQWPLKDGYWLQLDTGPDSYLPGKDIMAVLPRAEKALGKKPHSGAVPGLVEFGPDGSDPYNEAIFVIMPVFGNVMTWGNAVNAVVGFTEWYHARQLNVTTYFWLKDQEGGRGNIGYGAIKRRWQPFPPDYRADVSTS